MSDRVAQLFFGAVYIARGKHSVSPQTNSPFDFTWSKYRQMLLYMMVKKEGKAFFEKMLWPWNLHAITEPRRSHRATHFFFKTYSTEGKTELIWISECTLYIFLLFGSSMRFWSYVDSVDCKITLQPTWLFIGNILTPGFLLLMVNKVRKHSVQKWWNWVLLSTLESAPIALQSAGYNKGRVIWFVFVSIALSHDGLSSLFTIGIHKQCQNLEKSEKTLGCIIRNQPLNI